MPSTWLSTSCRAWYMDERFRDGRPLMGRSGYGININVQRRVYPGDAAAFLQRPPRHQDEGFIRERQTQGQVAHTPGPRLPLHSRQVPPKQLALAELLPMPELMTEPTTDLEQEIVRGLCGQIEVWQSRSYCTFLFWKYHVHMMKAGSLTSYLNGASIVMHIVLVAMMNIFACHLIGLPRSSMSSMAHKKGLRMVQPFCTHGMQLMGPLNALGHMKVLYRMGYIKTAIIEAVDLRPGLSRVVFAHLQPKLAAPAIAQKSPSEWPLPQPLGRDDFPPFDPASWHAECSDCCLAFGISLEELQEVFGPW